MIRFAPCPGPGLFSNLPPRSVLCKPIDVCWESFKLRFQISLQRVLKFGITKKGPDLAAQRYGVPLKWGDLRHLTLSSRQAREAALRVALPGDHCSRFIFWNFYHSANQQGPKTPKKSLFICDESVFVFGTKSF